MKAKPKANGHRRKRDIDEDDDLADILLIHPQKIFMENFRKARNLIPKNLPKQKNNRQKQGQKIQRIFLTILPEMILMYQVPNWTMIWK